MRIGIVKIEHIDHSEVELTNLKKDTFTYNPNVHEGLEDFLNGTILKDSPDDVFVLELSDNELTTATRHQIEMMKEDAMKHDGFYGFTVKGRLMDL